MDSKITITLKDNGDVDFKLDVDTESTTVLDGMTTALIGVISLVSLNYETRDRLIGEAVDNLNKAKMMTTEETK